MAYTYIQPSDDGIDILKTKSVAIKSYIRSKFFIKSLNKFFIKLLNIVSVVSVIMLFMYGISHAANQPLSLEDKITYNVLQQDIKSALKDMSTQMGIPINLAVNIKGKVAAGEYHGTGREILDQMTSDLNLQWFYDGNSIYVTKVADAKMKIIRLNSFSLDNLEKALDNIDLDIKKYPLKHDQYNNMVTVYGPPRFVAMVEVVAHYLTMRAMDKPSVIRGTVTGS